MGKYEIINHLPIDQKKNKRIFCSAILQFGISRSKRQVVNKTFEDGILRSVEERESILN